MKDVVEFTVFLVFFCCLNLAVNFDNLKTNYLPDYICTLGYFIIINSTSKTLELPDHYLKFFSFSEGYLNRATLKFKTEK